MQRGSLTLWLTEDVVQAWHPTAPENKRGHPRLYTDTAIATRATLQEIYHLGVRQTEGLMQSIGELLHLEVAIPDYSTLSRRRATLEIVLPRTRSKEALHVVVDSTGVKVFGEGDWKVRQHGNTKAERLARDQNLRRIRQVGRVAWKRESGYHRRSLAETTMFRLKTIFSERVTARGFAGQAAQLLVRCAALNRMTQLGRPDSYRG